MSSHQHESFETLEALKHNEEHRHSLALQACLFNGKLHQPQSQMQLRSNAHHCGEDSMTGRLDWDERDGGDAGQLGVLPASPDMLRALVSGCCASDTVPTGAFWLSEAATDCEGIPPATLGNGEGCPAAVAGAEFGAAEGPEKPGAGLWLSMLEFSLEGCTGDIDACAAADSGWAAGKAVAAFRCGRS